MTTFNVVLSKQDLADFLDDDADMMEAYRVELERRLGEMGEAEVTISRNALVDLYEIDGEQDGEIIPAVMAQMVNDWSWLE